MRQSKIGILLYFSYKFKSPIVYLMLNLNPLKHTGVPYKFLNLNRLDAYYTVLAIILSNGRANRR